MADELLLQKFKEFLIAAGPGNEEAEGIVKTVGEEKGLGSVEAFFIYFKDFELKDIVKDIEACKKNGGVYVHMSMALTSARKVLERKEKQHKDTSEGDDNKPIGPETYKSLSEAWKKTYGCSPTLPRKILPS